LRILFLPHKLPRSLESGWTIRTLACLSGLAQAGSVHAVGVRRWAGQADELHQDDLARKLLNEYCAEVELIDPLPQRASGLNAVSSLVRHGPVMSSLVKNPAMRHRLGALPGPYDLVWLETLYTAQYASTVARIAQRAILNTHNVESELERQLLHQASGGLEKMLSTVRWLNLRRAERHYLPSMDKVIAASENDAIVYRRLLRPDRVEVVPNGVDTHRYSVGSRRPDPATLLFIGRLQYFPNQNGLRWFLTEVWPLIRAAVQPVRLVVVGHAAPHEIAELSLPGVGFAGRVPSVEPYLERATVSICPLLEGSGTRLKIIEAMAAGVPVVSTSKGAEGLEVTSGRHLLIADTPAQFAEAVRLVLTHDQVARDLAAEARALVNARYSWEAVGKRIVEICLNA
jgi:glycosyltransferase involved in cell wall biosynthesis